MRALFWALLLAGVVAVALWLLIVWLEHRHDGPPRRRGGGWPG